MSQFRLVIAAIRQAGHFPFFSKRVVKGNAAPKAFTYIMELHLI